MADVKPFTDGATNRQSPTIGDSDILLVGAGIEPSAAGALVIGATATSVTIGSDAVSSPQKRTVTVTHTTLDAFVALTGAVAIGAVLPANARIQSFTVKLTTPFTGGSASAVTLDIGTTGDIDAIVDGANVLAAAVDGQASTMPFGIAPFKHFVTAGTQLNATFTSDVNLSLLTAGSCTIDVFFTTAA